MSGPDNQVSVLRNTSAFSPLEATSAGLVSVFTSTEMAVIL